MKGLDRYLTTPPEEGLDNWAEMIVEAHTEEFYTVHEDAILDQDPKSHYNKWLKELFIFDDVLSYKQAAPIIEIAFSIHFKNI